MAGHCQKNGEVPEWRGVLMVVPIPDDMLYFRDYLMSRRQALLLELDTIERALCITPRVSELRKAAKSKEDHEQRREALYPDNPA